jgi:hypothetical protein
VKFLICPLKLNPASVLWRDPERFGIFQKPQTATLTAAPELAQFASEAAAPMLELQY